MIDFRKPTAAHTPDQSSCESGKVLGCGDGFLGYARPPAKPDSTGLWPRVQGSRPNNRIWSWHSFRNASQSTAKSPALYGWVLLFVLFLASCNGTSPTPTPEPTAPPTARPTLAPTRTPVPTPTPEPPISFEGPSDLKTAPFPLSGGTYAVAFTITGPANSPCITTGIRLQSTDEPKPGLFTGERITSDSASAGEVISQTTYLYNVSPGEYYIDAVTRCAWTVSISKQ